MAEMNIKQIIDRLNTDLTGGMKKAFALETRIDSFAEELALLLSCKNRHPSPICTQF